MVTIEHKGLKKLNQVDRLIIATWLRNLADSVENGEVDEITVKAEGGYPGARHL